MMLDPQSAWSPLRIAVFRALWVANLASTIGTWVHEVGAGWLMTELRASPMMVALVQSAASLPMVLLVLPAGVLADVVDRRKILLVAQVAMAAVALALAGLTWSGGVAAWSLLAVTAVLGAASAVSSPAWQTVMTDLVPRGEVGRAVGLHGVSLSVSRALGPAIGGALVWWGGPGAAFACNAASFVGLIAVLTVWRADIGAAAPVNEPERRPWAAVGEAWRFVRGSAAFGAVLWRTGLFVFFAAAVWGLLPLIAREHLHLGPAGFGMLVGCLGAGAVGMAWWLPSVQRRAGPSVLVGSAALMVAAGLLVIVAFPVAWWACLAMAAIGAGWVTNVTLVNAAAQTLAPAAIKGQAFGCYLATHFGALAAGSAAFGALAQRTNLSEAMTVAAAGLVLGVATLGRWRLAAAG